MMSSNVNNTSRSVRFNPSARFIVINPSSSPSSSSKRSMTDYTEDDYKRIKKSVKKTLRAVRRFHEANPDGNFDDDQEFGSGQQQQKQGEYYSIRGLEHLRTPESLEQQIINKDCAIEAVLVAQYRLDDMEDAEFEHRRVDQDLLEKRIRDIYEGNPVDGSMSVTTDTSHQQLTDAQIDRRSQQIAASYRSHNRWALQNALDLAARDEAYVDAHVRPTLEQELRELHKTERARGTPSLPKGTSTASPQHTLATLQESLALNGDERETEPPTNGPSRKGSAPTAVAIAVPSSLSAATIADMAASSSSAAAAAAAASSSLSRPLTSSATSRNPRPRPHAPSRMQPPYNWLQHRDSLQLSLQNSMEQDSKAASTGTRSTVMGRRASANAGTTSRPIGNNSITANSIPEKKKRRGLTSLEAS